MRRPFLAFLLVFVFLTLADGSDRHKTATSAKSVAAQSAASQATAELNKKSTEIDRAVQNATPTVQDKIKSIEVSTSPVVSGTVIIVDKDKRAKLAMAVRSTMNYAEHQQRVYSRWSMILTFVSAGLALVGGIASFMSKNKLAGIISLIVATLVSLSNTYPFGSLADFYGDMKSQASELATDCDFGEPYTETLYRAEVDQYELLILSEEKRPSVGNHRNSIHDATEEMKRVSVAASNADTAKAAANQIPEFRNTAK